MFWRYAKSHSSSYEEWLKQVSIHEQNDVADSFQSFVDA